MIYIEAVHMEGGVGHEHIASVRWRDSSDGKTGQTTRAGMVKFINDGNRVAVSDGAGNTAYVGVVNAQPPYIRTYADGVGTDNLLWLPRY